MKVLLPPSMTIGAEPIGGAEERHLRGEAVFADAESTGVAVAAGENGRVRC